MTKKLCCNVTKFRQIVSTEKLQCYNSITQFFSWNQATMQKKLQTIILWILLQLQNRHKNWNSFISVSFLLPDLSIILVKSSIFAKDLSKSIHFLSQKVFFLVDRSEWLDWTYWSLLFMILNPHTNFLIEVTFC